MSKLVIKILTAAHPSTLIICLLIRHRFNFNFALCHVFCVALRVQIGQGSLEFLMLFVHLH